MTLHRLLDERLQLPVICSPLFIISTPDLVIAQCKMGVVGSFPSLNARPLALLDEWLHRITEELAAWDRDHPEAPSAPFAVNQIVHHSNDRLVPDMEICAKYRVPLVITSLGARADINEAVHSWGGITMHDVIDDRFARKAIEKGADGLIAVAAGAGGHAGRVSPFALIQEIRRWFDGPVALSGSMGHGRSILAAQAMGADLAYIGSLFIATAEANADPAYKQMIVESSASDIVYTNLFTGVHGNYLAPSIIRAGLDPANLPESDPSKMNFASGGNTKAKAWRDVWGCGQGISGVEAIEPVGAVVARLAREYVEAKAELNACYIDPRSAPAPSPRIVAGERVRDHVEVIARAEKAASGLRRLGIGENACVALFLRNDFAFFEASMAAGLIGAFSVPINWHSTIEETKYILQNCDAKVLVIHRDLLSALASGIPDHIQLLVVDTPAEIITAYGICSDNAISDCCLDWDEWTERQQPITNSAPASRAALIYTSGTTGKPKGVRRDPDPRNRIVQAATVGFGLAEAGSMVVLINGPMYHSAPNSYARIAFAAASTIILQPRFDAEEMLQMIERHRVTHMHIVPTMFFRLLQLPDPVKARYNLSSLRHVVHGAAPCPPEIKRQMITWWGPIIHEYYGSTETGLITAHGSTEALAKPGTVGRALPGVAVRILGEHGESLPPGVVGSIYVRPDAPNFAYVGLADARAEVEVDGYVTVGDLGYFDEDNYLYLCDRARDMIISGGVNVYPAEIEAALHAIDGVEDCAVFGVPDAEFGETVCAYVQPVNGTVLDIAVLQRELGVRLSRFKIPRIIKSVPALTREDSGKISKRKLRSAHISSGAR